MATPQRLLSFSVFIYRNRPCRSYILIASLPLTVCHSPPYNSIKSVMKAPPLSTISTPASIFLPHVRNHLSIGAPPAASIERHRVVISAAPPPSDGIGENPDDLSKPRAAMPPHVHESTMDQESVVIPWFVDLIRLFLYKNIHEKSHTTAKRHCSHATHFAVVMSIIWSVTIMPMCHRSDGQLWCQCPMKSVAMGKSWHRLRPSLLRTTTLTNQTMSKLHECLGFF
jgi:hypothetical protein